MKPTPQVILLITLATAWMHSDVQGLVTWPAVRPFHKIFHFADASKAELGEKLKGTDGAILYSIDCHTGTYDLDPAFHYSGFFACKLQSLPPDPLYSTLLTDDPVQVRDWQGRGRFLTPQIEGACGDYPEFGRVRHFRLRGFRITLSISQVSYSRSDQPWGRELTMLPPASFSFEIDVEPDAAAVSRIALDVPFAEPPRAHPGDGLSFSLDCARVVPRHVAGQGTEEYVRSEGLGPPYPGTVTLAEVAEVEHLKSSTSFPFGSLLPPGSVLYGHPPAQLSLLWAEVENPKGETEYILDCSGERPAGGVIDHRGVRCGLFPAGKETDLLADSVDEVTRMPRSWFTPWQLSNACKDFAEWGTVRHYRLRGMQITLSFSGLQLSREPDLSDFVGWNILSATIRATVAPDPSATAPVALPIPDRDLCDLRLGSNTSASP